MLDHIFSLPSPTAKYTSSQFQIIICSMWTSVVVEVKNLYFKKEIMSESENKRGQTSGQREGLRKISYSYICICHIRRHWWTEHLAKRSVNNIWRMSTGSMMLVFISLLLLPISEAFFFRATFMLASLQFAFISKAGYKNDARGKQRILISILIW